MILVTVGTNEQAFDRLVRAAAALDTDEPLIVQYGASKEPHGRGTWIEVTSFDELADLMRQAREVVCHAGVGSIMLARRCGKVPVVVPRRLAHGEAVDDHQFPLARRLDAAGVVRLVEDEGDLGTALTSPATGSDELRTADHALPGVDALAGDVRLYLERLLAA